MCEACKQATVNTALFFPWKPRSLIADLSIKLLVPLEDKEMRLSFLLAIGNEMQTSTVRLKGI